MTRFNLVIFLDVRSDRKIAIKNTALLWRSRILRKDYILQHKESRPGESPGGLTYVILCIKEFLFSIARIVYECSFPRQAIRISIILLIVWRADL